MYAHTIHVAIVMWETANSKISLRNNILNTRHSSELRARVTPLSTARDGESSGSCFSLARCYTQRPGTGEPSEGKGPPAAERPFAGASAYSQTAALHLTLSPPHAHNETKKKNGG